MAMGAVFFGHGRRGFPRDVYSGPWSFPAVGIVADTAAESDSRADHAIDQRDYCSELYTSRRIDGSERYY